MAKHSRWVAHENPETWHPQQKGNIEADGSTLRPLYHQDTELVMDILRHGADVEVVAPAALRTACAGRWSGRWGRIGWSGEGETRSTL